MLCTYAVLDGGWLSLLHGFNDFYLAFVPLAELGVYGGSILMYNKCLFSMCLDKIRLDVLRSSCVEDVRK